ncbi:glutamate-5-semialdehyde dehydrogenase [Thioalkalivibrio sp. XN279]|uniref:glutamate-5-semialdehyde dehydrogenase n=1 Tax=Thioalkalivibrio sp. XN279 TaxID=2714953 RepID=UPI00140A1DC7|nr:glutamate-5-semialdehyde dehydrogenase [Thioalkalivibrio sp. XN279]NHA14871.1 glutamate-5-semialdehyde dehydrogenase [Thioalkalivibrio sp. XN279]
MVDLMGQEGPEAVQRLMAELGHQARKAAAALARATPAARDTALEAAAALLRERAGLILQANADDVAAAEERGLSAAMLDRLRLDQGRIEAMATGIEAIRALPDPLGRVLAEWSRPNGLLIRRVSVPLGVIGIIYESRPNVTADAGALCLKSGNAVILRGGSESFATSMQIHACLAEALRMAGLPAEAVQMVPTRDRAAVGELLGGLGGCVDVVVPRGGRSLIERVQRDARVPVIGHLEGICHVYVDGAADLAMAREVVLNSKMRRTGICGAAETLLVDRACADSHLQPLVRALLDAGCEVRGDAAACAVDRRVREAVATDWGREFLDAIIAVRVVDGAAAAITHIARFGSGHTESIVTADEAVARRFLDEVDSAIVLHNASTQFADGGEFGMGAEIGISTGRIHARGPVGVEQLTSYKYQVLGSGQTRP